MEELRFVLPAPEHEAAVADYIAEHAAAGETHLHGSSLLTECGNYGTWLALLLRNADPAAAQAAGWVQATTLLCLRASDGRLIGMVDIRHTLNDFLRACGGHIGYGVRPTERRKGYASQMLRHACSFCAGLGIRQIMLGCDKCNPASAATIRNCGGRLEREFRWQDGSDVQVYLIEAPQSPIGLPRGTVELREHDPVWDSLAASAALTLKSIFGADAADVQHVGSTAVPKLAAKPILDLAVGVRSLEAVPQHLPALAAAGFLHVPENDTAWQYFCSAGDRAADIRTHHIHIVEHGGARWAQYLAFRDALRADPALRMRYEALKRTLRETYPNDREAYTEAKAAFICEAAQNTVQREIR